MTITRPPITHIEVLQANEGERVYGIKTGQLLTVLQVTPCFVFAKSFSGREIKISKKTQRACHWGNANTSPVFNI
jgi:hypothetical protein